VNELIEQQTAISEVLRAGPQTGAAVPRQKMTWLRDFAAQAHCLREHAASAQYRGRNGRWRNATRRDMGQLTASIAHEVNQPINRGSTNGAGRPAWMSAEPPDFGELTRR